MSEQQYRVHHCSKTEPHEAHNFRGVYRKPSLPGVEITETFQCVGIVVDTSTADFTPTTAQVRDAYVHAMRNAFIASASEHRQEFDRWLELERFKSRQDGYALRMHDEREGIGANRDEWLETPKEDADG